MYKQLILLAIASVLFIVTESAVVTPSLTKDELRTLQRKIITDCKKEHNVADGVMESFIKSANFEPPEGFKCMLNCYGEKIGLINDNKIDWDVLILERKIHHGEEKFKSKMASVVENCKNTVKSEGNKCDLSYNLAKCMQQGHRQACGDGKC